MKKKIATLLIVGSAVLLVGCDKTTIIKYTEELDRSYSYTPNELQIANHSLSLYVGESVQLDVNLYPALAYDAVVLYSSQDETVASVNALGVVTALKAGVTFVTAIAEVNTDAKDTIRVNVLNPVDKGTDLYNALDNMYTYQQNLISTNPVDKMLSIDSDRRSWYADNGNGYELQRSYFGDDKFTGCLSDPYLKIDGHSEHVKTVDGNVDVSNYSWIIFPEVDNKSCLLFHVDGGTKTYIDARTAHFIGQPRLEALYSILDSLFTSGREIMTNYYETALSEEDLRDAKTWDRFITGGGIADNQVCYDLEQLDYPRDADENYENNLYIPYGTKCREDIKIKYTWEKGLIRNFEIYEEIRYKIGDVNWKMTIERTYTYFYGNEEVTIETPKKSDYKQVYDIFDL